MADTKFLDLTLETAVNSLPLPDGPEGKLLQQLYTRTMSVRLEQARFRAWCLRADLLYYAENFTRGGADLWYDDPSASTPGRSHVSVNTPSVYVDIPAALQAVEPIENMLATTNEPEARHAAAGLERIYFAWKREENFELKFHKACTVKALYGRTAGKVYWDAEEQRPCLEVVEQPRNLFLGYKSDSYEAVEWAAYVTRMEPNAVAEEFGVDLSVKAMGNGTALPIMQMDTMEARSDRSWLNLGPARVEVWDYWYRKPAKNQKGMKGRGTRMSTWNVVFAGTLAVRGPFEYPEYNGVIPYIPLFNTFLPGIPNGRPELYDMEQLIREKFTRITSGAQMIASGVAGDYWQLTGPEAPSRVDPGVKPVRNEVIAPGPGNRIESITPFIAQFQLEQYLGRLDREMAIMSGLNDLLLGLAPSQVLSSSKAINALLSNYESRLAMKRGLLYKWRRETWEMAVRVWAAKNKDVKMVVANGGGRLDIEDPSLSPRDEMETATRAANLVTAKLWSQRRGMDAVGVDDPETEQDMIREERTDATLFPADVQVMAQLMAALQSLGLNANDATQGQAQQIANTGQADLRESLGAATPANTPGSVSPDQQGQTPPIPGADQASGGASPTPFAQGPAPAGRPGGAPLLQSRITGGTNTGRIQSQVALGKRP
jgi:hypothetical protein